MTNMGLEKYFFCYRAESVAIAEEFNNHLKSKKKYSQLNIWFSKDRPVGNYKKDIAPAVKQATGAVLFISEGFTHNFLNDASTDFECITALEMIEIAKRKQQDERFLIIAVNIDGYTFSEKDRRTIKDLLKKANISKVDSILDSITQIQKNPYFTDMHSSEKRSFWDRMASSLLQYSPNKSHKKHFHVHKKMHIVYAMIAIFTIFMSILFFAGGEKIPNQNNSNAYFSYVQSSTDIPAMVSQEEYLEELLLRAKTDHLNQLLEDDPHAGIVALQEEAQNGNKDAMYLLGTAYFWGEAVKRDIHEAFNWFISAANLQHIESYFAIGLMYATGIGIEQDDNKAIEFFRLAVDRGYSDAEIVLNALYLNDPATRLEANIWFQAASDTGNTEAMCLYAYGLLEGEWGFEQNVDKAICYYTKAADAGNVFAMYKLGDLFLDGDFVAMDYSRARYWYQKIMQSNTNDMEIKSQAMIQLGWLYVNGLGVTQNFAEAFRMYEQAAALQNPVGLYNLGYCYFMGDSVPQNYPKAMELFVSSAEKGYCPSMNILGDMYYYGRGTALDYRQAFQYYVQAAEAGDPYGALKTGYCYQKGLGTLQSNELATVWYNMAYEVANELTFYPLGVSFAKGIEGILEQDVDKGVTLLMKAAEAGNYNAIEDLNLLIQNEAIRIKMETGEYVSRFEYDGGTLYCFPKE